MKPSVYLETSVISCLVGRLAENVVVLGNQELTREWWANRRPDYDLFISEVVTEEAASGDPDLARRIRPAGHLHAARTVRKVTAMWEDPIVEETRAAREELFARFNHDLAALCQHLRKKEREHSGRVVTRERRRPEVANAKDK